MKNAFFLQKRAFPTEEGKKYGSKKTERVERSLGQKVSRFLFFFLLFSFVAFTTFPHEREKKNKKAKRYSIFERESSSSVTAAAAPVLLALTKVWKRWKMEVLAKNNRPSASCFCSVSVLPFCLELTSKR